MKIADPILDLIGRADENRLHQVLDALIDLDGPSAQAVASYAGLPRSQFERLAKASTELRAVIAERPDCPHQVAATLVEDPDSDVRRCLASNPAIADEHLVMLASDTDEWVRWSAYRNPQAQDAHRAAVALLSPRDHLQIADQSECLDPATLPERLRELTLTSVMNPNQAKSRAELALNPNLPSDCVPDLMAAAIDRREWSCLWKRHGGIWPTTYAFMNPHTPDWTLTVLREFGHPAILLSGSVEQETVCTSPVDSLVQLIDSGLLVRALWRELALERVVELEYWNDLDEGDKFYPSSPSVPLLDPHSPAHFILGGYSEDREWIETDPYLSEDSAVRVAAQWFDTEGLFDLVDFDEDSLDLMAIAGLAYLMESESEGLSGLSLTESGLSVLNRVLERGDVYVEHNDFDTRVMVIDSSLPNITFAGTLNIQKVGLVDLLQASRGDPMLNSWGISSHFLMCIAMHPATPDHIREQLQDDEDPQVRLAARISMDGAQRGVAGPAQSLAGQMNTLVFSSLIPEGRLEEARIWLSQIIDYDVDYEFWNAASNLGIVEFISGNIQLARDIFETVRACGDGPTFEAEEYLARIDSGDVVRKRERPRYSDEWRQFPIEGATPHDDQQSHYYRSLRIMEANVDDKTLVDAWVKGRGEYATAFIDAAMDSEGVAALGISRETIAKSLADYVETVLLQLPDSSEARGQGIADLAAGNRPRAEILLRRAAVRGDREAASALASLLIADGQERTGNGWLTVSESGRK